MNRFDPSNIKVTIIPPATMLRPVDGRRYTLTHSIKKNETNLSIGHQFDFSKLDEDREEVLALWTYKLGHYILAATVFVADEHIDEHMAELRFTHFQKHIEEALQHIVTGDQPFYKQFPWLLDAPIYVNYESCYKKYYKTIYYGTPRKYLLKLITNV